MKRVLFFLGQLNDRDIEWMVSNGDKIKIDIGSKLVIKGNNIDYLYIVLSGQLSVYSDEAVDNTIAVLGAGEIVGEMSFLESRPPSVSVIATQETLVFAISKKAINTRLKTNPDFKANFYYSLALFLSNRLRKTTSQLGYGQPEEEDVIDFNVLNNVAQAGGRFNQILTRFSEV